MTLSPFSGNPTPHPRGDIAPDDPSVKPRHGYAYRYHVGVDLGQSIDSTAISVVEHERLDSIQGYQQDTYRLRHLERIPLGTSYPQQAAHVHRLMSTAPLKERGTLIVDQTGVGRPVVDIFRDHDLKPHAVSITGGDKEHRDGDGYKVPKLVLVGRLQAALHAGNLEIASGLPEREALVQELQDFRVSYTEGSGYARMGAREGRHDDLVLSLALAMWSAASPRGAVKARKVDGF